MNVKLTYQSGQQYSDYFSKFDVKVSRGTTRIKVSFREKGQKAGAWGYATWSLPPDKAKQLAHAILTACAGDVQPIEFPVEEPVTNKSVAA